MEENTATHLVSQVLTANESSGRSAAFGRNGISNWDLRRSECKSCTVDKMDAGFVTDIRVLQSLYGYTCNARSVAFSLYTPVHPSKKTVGKRASQVHDAHDVAQGSQFCAVQKSLSVRTIDLPARRVWIYVNTSTKIYRLYNS